MSATLNQIEIIAEQQKRFLTSLNEVERLLNEHHRRIENLEAVRHRREVEAER